MLIEDNGKIINLPLSCLVIEFLCPNCNRSWSCYIWKGKTIEETFGKCRTCKAPMIAKNARADLDKLHGIVKEELGIEISFTRTIN